MYSIKNSQLESGELILNHRKSIKGLVKIHFLCLHQRTICLLSGTI